MNKHPENEDREIVERLKDYIERLSKGEDLESVREEFVKHFKTVDASDIARAEQEIIKAGTPVSEVQKLCDVHSALFHGTTQEEQIRFSPVAMSDSFKKIQEEKARNEKQLSAQETSTVKGHPVATLMAENKVLGEMIKAVRDALEKEAAYEEVLEKAKKLRVISNHYDKKGDLVYPLLNKTYGFSGPSEVMWGVDDEIRDEIKVLVTKGERLTDFRERLEKVAVRADEMIYKENNILLPLCLRNFNEADWMRIYYEIFNYDTFLPDGYDKWDAAEEKREELKTVGGKTVAERQAEGAQSCCSLGKADEEGYVTLGTGMMTPKQIEEVLNTIPMELTFVDDKNINRFFDRGEKIFKRPAMAIGRDVFSCHPPKIANMVTSIIESFRAGAQDSVDIWMEKQGKPVYVRYMAVRDEEGKYLGVLECVQVMDFAKKKFAPDSDK